MEKIISQNLDANETIFFENELESVKAKTYDIKYPQLKAMSLIPVSTDAGTGAESIAYYTYDQVGIMKIISNYADDLPRSDVYGTKEFSKVKSLGGSYGYNIQEVRAAAMANKPLNTRKAASVRKANEIAVDNIAWSGDANAGLIGLLNNPNIPSATAPDGASTDPEWSTKTAKEILEDMNSPATLIEELTKGVEAPDTKLLPIAQWRIISTTRLADGTDTTIKEFFLKNNPQYTAIEAVNNMKDVAPLPSGAAGPADIMLDYTRNPDILTLEIPQPFEQFAAEPRGLEFVVPAHSRIGGVIVYYPLALNIMENI